MFLFCYVLNVTSCAGGAGCRYESRNHITTWPEGIHTAPESAMTLFFRLADRFSSNLEPVAWTSEMKTPLMKRHYRNQGTFLRNRPEPWQQVSFYSSARRLCCCCRLLHALVQRIGVYPERTASNQYIRFNAWLLFLRCKNKESTESTIYLLIICMTLLLSLQHLKLNSELDE